MSKSLLITVLTAFVAVALVDPADQIFHLKMPLFAATMLVWLLRVALARVPSGDANLWMGVLLFAAIIPGAASVVGMLGTSLPVGGPTFATMKSFLVLLLIPVIASERVDLAKIIIRWSVAVAMLTFAMVIVSVVAPVVFDALYAFTLAKDNAMLNLERGLGIGMGSFYYKTVAVLVIPLAYHFRKLLWEGKKRRSILLAAIFLAAIIFSGSRATVLAAALVLGLHGLAKLNETCGWRVTALTIVVAATLAGALFIGFFDPEEESNAVKLGHVHSYIAEFNQHPSYLLWGQGADTQFFTEGFGEKTNTTEVTYLEIVRIFGIPVAVLCLVILAYPLLLLARSRGDSLSYLAPAYLAYLLESASNPLLVGSTGLLVVVSVWGVVLTRRTAEPRALPAGAAA